MTTVHLTIYFLKGIVIASIYMNKNISKNVKLHTIFFTQLFSIQIMDLFNLCFIYYAITLKRTVQTLCCPVGLVYTILMNGMLMHHFSYYTDISSQILFLYFHIFLCLIEIFYTYICYSAQREEFNLHYFRRFGASRDLHKIHQIRELLEVCTNFCLFSICLEIIHNYKEIYDMTIRTAFITIAHIHILLICFSFIIFKNKEIRSVRIIQIINVLVAIIISFFHYHSLDNKDLDVEKCSYHIMIFFESFTLSLILFVSFLDYRNFDKGLEFYFKR